MFTDEFIKEHNLSDTQVSAITGMVKGHYDTNVIPDLKKSWDGKANTDAEAILEGASSHVAKTFSLDLTRDQGEKFADYLKRVSDKVFETEKAGITKKQTELDAKLKNFEGDSEWKGKYDELSGKFDSAQQKLADLEGLESVKTDYETLQDKYSKLQKIAAFSQIKPAFPKEVNAYEAEAKWNAFVQKVLSANNLEVSEDGTFAVDKENPHKKSPLKDLLTADADVQALLKGRKQEGLHSGESVDIEGVPFDVPKDADSATITKLVREHLKKELGTTMGVKYSKEFSALYAKIKKSL